MTIKNLIFSALITGLLIVLGANANETPVNNTHDTITVINNTDKEFEFQIRWLRFSFEKSYQRDQWVLQNVIIKPHTHHIYVSSQISWHQTYVNNIEQLVIKKNPEYYFIIKDASDTNERRFSTRISIEQDIYPGGTIVINGYDSTYGLPTKENIIIKNITQ